MNVYILMSEAKEDGHIWTLPVHMPAKKYRYCIYILNILTNDQFSEVEKCSCAAK